MADNFFETEYFSFEKKTGPGQIRTQDMCRPKNIRYPQAKLTGNVKIFEYVMKQGRDDSRRVLWTKLFAGKKSNPIAKPLLSQG